MVELRIFSDEGAWKWIGTDPPDVNAGWETFSATIQESEWNEFEGNPEGFVRIVESGGGAPDAFVVPGVYLGDWRQLDTPRIDFDYRHRSTSGANRPVEILIIGPGAVFRWTGALPGDVWSHQTANVIASEWTQVSGDATFDELLGNVLRVEVSADQAQGSELNSIDNFSLLTADTPPVVQSLTVSPGSISFSGVATGPNPDPVAVTISFDTQGAAAGIRDAAQITFTAVGATVSPVVVVVRLILSDQPNPTPVISTGGVVNAATYQAQLAPGTLATIFGQSLGGTPEGAVASFVGRTKDSLPTQINGVRVLIFNSDGLLIGEAPITYLGDSQINFQMLFEVAGLAVVDVAVDNAGAISASQRVQITGSAPGIFTYGQGRAVAVNGDGTLNTAGNPVSRRQVLTVYMTGQGPVAPALASGKAAGTNPLVLAPLRAVAFVAGHEVVIDFLGMAPGLVGVLQFNMRPSHFTPLGDQSLIVNIGGHDSNVATISIQ